MTICLNSAATVAPRSVATFLPSMKTGAAGCSPVPGSEMPMSACLLSPGPLTMQPMTATLSVSTPRHPGLHPRVDAAVDEALDVAGEFLERGRGRAPAARARGDERHEYAKAHGLQQFLRHLHFERAVAPGLWRE